MKISMDEVDRILQMQGVTRINGNGSYSNGGTAVAEPQPAAVVDVSKSAQEIQRVKKLVNETPDVREDAVQALKAKIEGGTYNVSGAEIADLMVRRSQADRIR